MDALDLIRHEHQQILRIIDLLEAAIADGRAKGRVNPSLFQRAADFLRVFVEGAHHAKESALHRELRAHGVSADSGLLRQLSDEHAIGRENTAQLRGLAVAVARREVALEVLLDHAEAYVRLHRLHSQIEDGQLLPLAQRLLGPDAGERLRSSFARVEARYGSLLEAADALEVAFGQPTARRARAGVAPA